MSEHGEVVTPLGTLRCTLRAAKEVSAYFGNYLDVFKKLAVFDHDAYVAIVAAGLGKARKDVEEDVYKAGLPTLTEPLSDYIGLLSNGGRPAATDDAGKPTAGEA